VEKPAVSSGPLPYMPGLDVLRGIAIVMVLVFHGLAPYRDGPGIPHWVALALWSSYHGVHFFFILSGFLITGILLDSRDQTDYFRNFYVRRVRRIVPAYLAVLAVLALMHHITLRYLGICLLFFANMTGLFGLTAEYGPLWSLSVEEQFYLLWPLTVRKLSQRSVAKLCIALILATPFLRFALLLAPAALHDIRFKAWALLDFFAAGALLAIAIRNPAYRTRLRRIDIPLMVAGAVLFILLHLLHQTLSQNVLDAIAVEPWLLLFTGLTLLAYFKPHWATTAITKPLIFLAKISYGLYLCHVLVFQYVTNHWSAPSMPWLQFFVETALAIGIATLSRFTLEAWFLRRKPARHLT
jgi:peptidoglycan/LPS O-acetylase OafA/YrhL